MIKYVIGEIVVFEVNNKLYYFKDGRNLPELYDEYLVKQIVPNMDNWLQTNTSQRYSLRGLRDMAAAFTDGLRCGIYEEDAIKFIKQAVQETKNTIFQSALTNDYAHAYFIELIDPIKVESTHLPTISKNLQKLRKKCGDARLFNYLCRFWQLCNHHALGTAGVFENMIRRLGRTPTTPQYPNTTELDNDLLERVCHTVFKRQSLYHVPDEIVYNAKKLIGNTK